MTSTSLPNVMISYQWDCQAQMIKLKKELKQKGFNVWMDIERMEGDLLDCMSAAVEQADVILACISEKYQKSKSCKTEAKYAYNKDVPIIPVKLDEAFNPSGWLGALVGTSLYYVLDNEDTFNKNFPNLLRAITKIECKTVTEQPVKPEASSLLPSTPSKHFKLRTSKALDCSICLERFRNPKTLPCLHSFCKECLLGCAPYGTKTISCPLCREVATIPDGDVNKLKSNFHLQELVEEEALQEQATSSDSSKFTCTCCEGDTQSQAVGKCQNCKHYLCRSSLEAHHKFPDLKKHIVVVFEDKDTSSTSSNTPSHDVGSEEKPSAQPAGQKLSKTGWEIFEALYNEDHSGNLLKYWMQQQGDIEGWQITMVQQYMAGLDELEEDGVVSEAVLAKKQQKVARVFMQAGKYEEAITMVKKIIALETKELGARPEKLADLYGLAAAIHSEITKMIMYIRKGDEGDLAKYREVLRNARKSIKLRKTLPGDDHKFRLGKTLVIIVHALQRWIRTGGDSSFSTEDADEEAKRHIKHAIEIFKTLDSKGNLADAIMTEGLLCGLGSTEQKELYMESYRWCIQAYGECSILTRRLCFNIGIMYENRKEYYDAYDWYVEAEEVSEKIYGYNHEKTQKLRKVFEEPNYAYLKEKSSGCHQEKEADPNESRGEAEPALKEFKTMALEPKFK